MNPPLPGRTSDGEVGDVGLEEEAGDTKRVEDRLRGCGRAFEEFVALGTTGAVLSDNKGGRGRPIGYLVLSLRTGMSDSEERRVGVGGIGFNVWYITSPSSDSILVSFPVVPRSIFGPSPTALSSLPTFFFLPENKPPNTPPVLPFLSTPTSSPCEADDRLRFLRPSTTRGLETILGRSSIVMLVRGRASASLKLGRMGEGKRMERGVVCMEVMMDLSKAVSADLPCERGTYNEATIGQRQTKRA